jgi:hypothetical protein
MDVVWCDGLELKSCWRYWECSGAPLGALDTKCKSGHWTALGGIHACGSVMYIVLT